MHSTHDGTQDSHFELNRSASHQVPHGPQLSIRQSTHPLHIATATKAAMTKLANSSLQVIFLLCVTVMSEIHMQITIFITMLNHC